MNATTTRRRFRVAGRFGQAPRFVFATSALFARLTVWRLTAVSA